MRKMNEKGIKVVCLVMTTAICAGGIGTVVTNAQNLKQTTTYVASKEEIKALADKVGGTNVVSLEGDETVYVISDANGNVNKVYVSETENGEKVKKDADAENLPVGVKATYFLDDEEISPEDLAGKSGKVKIRYDYTNTCYEEKEINGKTEKIYVPFVMITGMILDQEKFTNIEISNGKVTNDGNRTIAVGFAMPGMQDSLGLDKEDIDIPDYMEITADVTDFELGMSMTVATNSLFNDFDTENFSKLDEITDKLDEMTDGMDKLLEGSDQLANGLKTLVEKSGDLVVGVNKLNDGASQLANGTTELNSGAQKLSGGAQSLQSGASTLSNGANSLEAGTQDLATGASSLAEGTAALAAGSQNLTAGAGQLAAGTQSLADGAGNLATGSAALVEGEKSLADGINALNSGLSTLAANNEALNGGGAQVFDGLLDSANKSLAESGINVTLTKDNYAQVLGSLDASMIAPVVTEQAQAKVEAQVRANTATIYAGVEEAVRDQVIDGVIAAAGIPGVTKDTYKAAIASGDTASMMAVGVIAANVDSQMSSADIKATIANNTEAQVQALIAQNMASEAVQAQINGAVSAAAESLSSLKNSLDLYNSFYNGLVTYTNGVSDALAGVGQLSAGEAQLSQGISAVNDGAAALKSGADQVNTGAAGVSNGAATLQNGISSANDGAAKLSNGAAALNNGAVQLNQGVGALLAGSTDLRDGALKLAQGTQALETGASTLSEGTSALVDGSGALVDGVNKLSDGSTQLSDGLKEFNEKAIQKLTDLVNDKVSPVADRVRAMADVSANYKSFSHEDAAEGSVKFIIKTDEIKVKES